MSLRKTYPAELDGSVAYDFVKNFISASFTEVGRYGAVKPDGHLAPWDEIYRKLDLARGSMKHAPTEKHMAAALEEWKAHRAVCAEVDTINSLAYVGPSDALDQLLTAMVGEKDENKQLHKAILEHFIWQVKRKMHGLPVSYHLMPVFVGRTGSGKSQALDKFLAPLGPLVETGVDFSIFADERNWHLFGEKYVFLFDEMSKARKADVESLKNTITAKEKSYRKLHTNLTITVQQKSTFVGASNDPVSSQINDPTSARRFYEIRTLDKCDWDTINKINMKSIWQSVDEGSQHPPILAYWSQIAKIQDKEVRSKSNPEMWFEDSAEIADDYVTRASDLYEAFKEWENKYDERAKTSAKFFYVRLADLPEVRKKSKVDAVYYNVRLKALGRHLKILPKGQEFQK